MLVATFQCLKDQFLSLSAFLAVDGGINYCVGFVFSPVTHRFLFSRAKLNLLRMSLMRKFYYCLLEMHSST